jgi:hypothetical protein
VQAGPGADELVAAFVRWAADQRVAAAASERSRERSLRDQAGASATWAGILVDLAEQATIVTAVVAGRSRRGRIVGVGRDFCVLESEQGRTALVLLEAISELRPESDAGRGVPAGDREAAIDLPLSTALALLAEDRHPVATFTGAGFPSTGVLLAAGQDVLTLRADPPGRRLVYVPLSAVALCELR